MAGGAAWELANPRAKISPEASTLLATVLGALVGTLAAYLNGRPPDDR